MRGGWALTLTHTAIDNAGTACETHRSCYPKNVSFCLVSPMIGFHKKGSSTKRRVPYRLDTLCYRPSRQTYHRQGDTQPCTHTQQGSAWPRPIPEPTDTRYRTAKRNALHNPSHTFLCPWEHPHTSPTPSLLSHCTWRGGLSCSGSLPAKIRHARSWESVCCMVVPSLSWRVMQSEEKMVWTKNCLGFRTVSSRMQDSVSCRTGLPHSDGQSYSSNRHWYTHLHKKRSLCQRLIWVSFFVCLSRFVSLWEANSRRRGRADCDLKRLNVLHAVAVVCHGASAILACH
jgi:hypothetical protein